MRSYLGAAALVLCGALLSVTAELLVPSEPQQTVAQIDFAALHRQATTALDTLRQSRDRRMIAARAATF